LVQALFTRLDEGSQAARRVRGNYELSPSACHARFLCFGSFFLRSW